MEIKKRNMINKIMEWRKRFKRIKYKNKICISKFIYYEYFKNFKKLEYLDYLN